MKIYLVMNGEYPIAVCSTEELAQKRICARLQDVKAPMARRYRGGFERWCYCEFELDARDVDLTAEEAEKMR